MRTETVTRTIYTYAELMEASEVTQRAKDKATDSLRDIAWDPEFVTETLQEAAKAVVGDQGFIRVTGWDAGRGQSVDFDGVFVTPLPDSGWDDAPTLELQDVIEISKLPNDYYVRNDFSLAYWQEDRQHKLMHKDDYPFEYEVVGWFLWEFESWLVSLAVSEIDHLDSDENIASFAEANEFEFYADGSRV